MSDFFKQLPKEPKTHRYEFRVTQKEFDKIRQLANIHLLSTSEFVRRTSLARRADIPHDLAQNLKILNSVTAKLRAMRETLAQGGLPPPEKKLREALDEAMSAVLRISK